ncbi:CLUMA_CG013092, isoform A [Clunio marinus]|uniref:CLUMA_CG013092, isoform A n=1 Tax=Clunio marinus TaxID=568069 RepID=A0A1J1IHV5_9DIPT|nr:CLUMA_CG013092, isoform A [Clunio marinus]
MSEESAKLRMNLVAIQNADPYAKKILDSSPHVAFYKFVNSEWEKSEIEGSFFVYSRVAEPLNSIFINNRLNTNSLVEPITKQIELQSQPPFLLYRNQRSAISGFWFYCKEDCVRVHSLLENLIKKCNNAKPSDNNGNNHSSTLHQQQFNKQQFEIARNGAQNKDVDIFSMLSKAQEDFNNAGTSVPDKNVGPQLNQAFAGMQLSNNVPQQHQPLMKQLSTTMPDITSPNVVSFFAAAQQPNGFVKPDGSLIQSQINKPIVVNHAIVPPVQTLDEIEKQHRVSASPTQPHLIKSDFNNLLNSVAQQQKQSISPQPVKLQQPGAFQQQANSNKPTLITPAMFQVSNNIVEEKPLAPVPIQSNIRPEPLTQNQLLQALNYMLETDPEFIRKIHEAYVKSFNKIVSL